MRYWKRLNADNSTNTVESYSHDLAVAGAIEITKKEYDASIASLPPLPEEPKRDLVSEIDDLKTRLEALEAKVG